MNVYEKERLFKNELRLIAEQLEQWANETTNGGWSTHQVDPMKKKAAEIYALLGRCQ